MRDRSESTTVDLSGKTGELLRQRTLDKFLEDRAGYSALYDLILQEEKVLEQQVARLTTRATNKRQELENEVNHLSLKQNQLGIDLDSVAQLKKMSAAELPRLDKGEWSDEELAHCRQRAEEDTVVEKASLDAIENRVSELRVNLCTMKLGRKNVLAKNIRYSSDLAILKEGARNKELDEQETKNLKKVETSFMVRRLSIEAELESLTCDLNKRTVQLAKLNKEFNESKNFENRLNKSSIAASLFSLVNPYNWRTRDSQSVALDIKRLDKSIQQIRIDIINKDNELRAILAKYSQDKLETIDRSRAEVIAKLTEYISATTLELSAYDRDIVVEQEKIYEEQTNLNNSLACYQNILSNKTKELLAKRAADFKANYENFSEQESQLEKSLEAVTKSINNLKTEIDGVTECLETETAVLTAEESKKMLSLRGELETIKLRLEERASRIGISLTKSLSDPDWKPEARSTSYSKIQNYIRERLELNYSSQPHASLPISFRSRINKNGNNYLSKKDDLLIALKKIGFIDSPTSDEFEQLKRIDSFSELVFGGDGERRRFYATCLDNLDDVSRVLLRPTTAGPRMVTHFSEDLVPCLSCSIEFSEGINRLQFWDVVLVPISAPRPFERVLELERRMGFESDIPLTHSVKELLEQSGFDFPAIRAQFRSRADDWFAYISWAKNQLYKQAPLLYLGKGELSGSTWVGTGTWVGRGSYNLFIKKAGGDDDNFPARYEIGLLGDLASNVNVTLVKIGHEVKEHVLPVGVDVMHPVSMEIEVTIRDRGNKVFQSWDEGVRVVYNVSSLIGSLTQLNRQSSSLERVFSAQDKTLKAHIYRQFGTLLGDAPYLSATFFNVTQAAVPTYVVKVPDGAWRNKNLNLDQKLAVQKMLSVPEIAYIQGPPGTGKTSMIAEACSHFVRMGKRVLIASQTNLAVDNALERLEDDPEIRSIRIRSQESDEDLIDTLDSWYKSAAEHTTKRILRPLSSLNHLISEGQRWLSNANSLLRVRRQVAEEVFDILRSKHEAQSELERAKLILQKTNESNADSIWWAHIIDVLNGASWEPSAGKNVTKHSVFRLFEYAADLHLPNLIAPKVGTSNEALQRHCKRMMDHIKAERSVEPTNVTDEAYEKFVSAVLTESNCGLKTNEVVAQRELDEVGLAKFRVAEISQHYDDAETRLREIDAKIYSALNASPVPVQTDENLEEYLITAVGKVENQLNMLKQQKSDYEVCSPWISLLQSWNDSIANSTNRTLKTDEVGVHYISSVNVAGITCNLNTKAFDEADLGRFDVVIIDEVSKATPLELLMPLQKAPCAILVGDHRQLPPTFEFNSTDNKASVNLPTPDENDDAVADEAALLETYKQLVTASLFKDGFEHIHELSKESLLTQYRMHPAIMNLVNRFYDNRLKCGLPLSVENQEIPKWAQREHGVTLTSKDGVTYLTPDKHVLWLDSTKDGTGKEVYETKLANGVYNELEVQLVTAVTKNLLEALAAAPEGKTVSVITFYNEQKRRLRSELANALGINPSKLRHKGVEIETVDRFQGKETDIVIVSMVRNPFYRLSQRSNPAKFERINVAFSRARDLLVIVGSDKAFGNFKVDIEPLDGKSSRKVNVYGQIIDQIRESGGFWRASDVLGSNLSEDSRK